ncbi:hypothetical protein AMATHDRAFT_69431 [Amanita thiersii Skay4041]|uniref:Uncharacterized protein n=1 Tax=Amanita thiersii Skay4041 TaxID=703135 RepID=A0A2A9N7U4_9AGAR|nr:hypothetical protein AMATHDRAFT_69431 [Amanita thiersii Skay4041]
MPVKSISKLLRLMLSRSCSCPLFIIYNDKFTRYNVIKCIKRILLKHICRWQVFENFDWCFNLERGRCSLQVPHLLRLTADVSTSKFLFASCPSLMHLTWNSRVRLTHNTVIPWH